MNDATIVDQPAATVITPASPPDPAVEAERVIFERRLRAMSAACSAPCELDEQDVMCARNNGGRYTDHDIEALWQGFRMGRAKSDYEALDLVQIGEELS